MFASVPGTSFCIAALQDKPADPRLSRSVVELRAAKGHLPRPACNPGPAALRVRPSSDDSWIGQVG